MEWRGKYMNLRQKKAENWENDNEGRNQFHSSLKIKIYRVKEAEIVGRAEGMDNIFSPGALRPNAGHGPSFLRF
jgi:hypothetical protein